MNKLYKILIAWLFTIGIGISFCSAEKVEDLITFVSTWTFEYNQTSNSIFKSFNLYNINWDYWTYCIKFTKLSDNSCWTNTYLSIWFASSSTATPTNNYILYFNQVGNTICLYGNRDYINIWNRMVNNNAYNSLCYTWEYEIYKLNTLLNTDIPQYTSSECQQEYNLIPIEYVNQNYCESNNLCPICNNNSWSINTGVNRSALFLNGQQITSNAIIDINAENYLKTDIEYLNDTVDIDISFEENTDYINNVINQEKLTPTKEDFETLLIWLAEFIPYLFIALLFIVIVKITRKIWK